MPFARTTLLSISLLLLSVGSVRADDTRQVATDWWDRPRLTGDWNGQRTSLEESGISVRSRVTQFVQGLPSGQDSNGVDYGGKFDFRVNSNLSKLGTWDGLSFTVQADYNFGQSANGRGGTVVPVNTALLFPGDEGSEAFDISNFYFTQTFGGSGAFLFGKINMIELAATRAFAGGAGIDSFWNVTFAAPPSGLVPGYMFGGVVSYKTSWANLGLWLYDPVDCVNRHCLGGPFEEGVTIRGNIEFPVTIGGRKGHHGFVGLYSTYEGTDLESLDNLLLPNFDPTQLDIQGERYYFAYTFDQLLYQSQTNPEENFGLFGQIGISDGNPTRLAVSGQIGVGGKGLLFGRNKDTWGAGFFYDEFADPLIRAVAPFSDLRDEYGAEVFYNFEVLPWFTVGADLQVIRPATANETAVFVGFRNVIDF